MKILLLLLLSIFVIAENNFTIKKANSKDIIYVLEKNGFKIYYNLSKENLKKLFNIKIKNEKLTNKKLLDLLIKNKPIKYIIKNKNIYFYNTYTKKKKNINIKKIIKNDNKIIKFTIKNNKDIEKLKLKLKKYITDNNLIYLQLNYYQENFNLIITNKNYFDLLKILEIKHIYNKKNLKNYQSLNQLKKNINNLNKIVNKNEQLLYNINENINNLSNYYFPLVKSYIKYKNKNYYYIQNIDYITNYNNLINRKDYIYLFNKNQFKYFNYSCKIFNFDIICYNKNYILKIGK